MPPPPAPPLAPRPQVLCNPELRRRYDAHGTEGLDINFMVSVIKKGPISCPLSMLDWHAFHCHQLPC